AASAFAAPELSPQERSDNALWTAFTLLNDRKFPEALAALEQARAAQDTESVRAEIAKLKARLDAAAAAARTAADTRPVLAARRRAAELRRDPTQLEDALAALRDAAREWDTLPVRQEIGDCTLALQCRRERLAVADFETRGDVGRPVFGRTVAEELLPAFKAR